jgi:phage protein D
MTGERLAPRFSIEVNGVGVRADVGAAVSEVTVSSEPDTFDQCTLTLANPYPEMRWTHDPRDAAVFKEGNGLVVKLGYGNELEPMFDGEITTISPNFPEAGTPTVRIEGYTRMHRLRGSPKTRTFLGMTDREIAQKVASELQLQLDADDPGVTHPYVIQFNQTDFAFLLERAQRVRYALQIEGRKLCFKKGGEAAQQTLTLVYGAALASSLESGELHPLRSFNPTMNTLRPVDHVIVRGHDAKTREPIEARAGARDADASLGGTRKGPAVTAGAFGAREQIVVDRPVASQSEADALARAIYTKRALEFVTGSGTALGLPELKAGRVVRLLGLGRFSGRYYVTQSTHTIGASGYTTSFTARSDSVS